MGRFFRLIMIVVVLCAFSVWGTGCIIVNKETEAGYHKPEHHEKVEPEDMSIEELREQLEELEEKQMEIEEELEKRKEEMA